MKSDGFGEVNRSPDMEGSSCYSKWFVLSSLEYLVLLKSKPLTQSEKSKKRINACSQEGLEPEFKMICLVYEIIAYLHFTP